MINIGKTGKGTEHIFLLLIEALHNLRKTSAFLFKETY